MIEERLIGNENRIERAILVGVSTRDITFEQAKEYLDELDFLTQTAGGKSVRSFIQRLDRPVNSTYVGSGKLEEIRLAIEETEADLVIFDDDLTPSQIRNIDRILDIKVLDRSALILHIFSIHARTAQAKAQVDLAQYQYMLPRLSGLWTHLSKQKGGIGMKGAGEKEIETDRRILRRKIGKLKQDLEKISRQNEERRKNRGEFVRVALVGYTNVGKSTLMNLLSKSDVLAEDKLFATLDTTVRKVYFGPVPFLLSDTVGFIRKLPHHLIECFESTLAEAGEADILVHMVDVSHPRFEDQIKVVNETLNSLGIHDRQILMVFNKADLLPEEARQQLENTWYARENAPSVFISAKEKENIPELRKMLTGLVLDIYREKWPFKHFIQEYEMQLMHMNAAEESLTIEVPVDNQPEN
jgi:GTP-binding protein HflX